MNCVLAADIGSGHGTKIGAFDQSSNLLGEGFLPVEAYGDNVDAFMDSLTQTIRETLERLPDAEPYSVGVACPGLFSADGRSMIVANLPFLTGHRPAELLGDRLNLPARLINDAAAGGMAEWHLARHELVYWVLGGGWGGTWMNADGTQRIPSLGWSGRLADLSCVNEPGFVIPLHRDELEPLLGNFGLTWEGLRAHLPKGATTVDTHGEWVRAESVTATISGLNRVFAACCKRRRGNTAILAHNEEMGEEAEDNILNLAERGFEPAVATAEFFVASWAMAVDRFYRLAADSGLNEETPVHLAGGLSHMSDCFLPGLREELRKRGLAPRLTVSLSHRHGRNANLLGAAQLAIRCLAETAAGA